MSKLASRSAVALFWSAVFSILYAYLFFPLLAALRGWLRPRPVAADDITPSVSLIIAAHNEAAVIERKLENVLALDYPAPCLEVIVASDGSDDGTNEQVRRYAGWGVQLLARPREGKAAALNAAAAVATGEILVFSDANSMYAPDALRHLVRPFADPAVGGVAGDQRYGPAGNHGQGERSYWQLDRQLKLFESAGGHVISATGAIYALRRELFRPVPDGVTDDFYNSTGVIAQGRRLVFAPDAAAYEPVSSERREFGRKVRIITRGLRGVYLRRTLLDPRRHGFYALQLFSHKVLRRLVVFPLMALLVLSLGLVRHGRFYQLAAAGQVLFYGLAAAGGVRIAQNRPVPRLLALPAYFCLVNLAALVAVVNLLRGKRIIAWDSGRSGAPPPPPGGRPNEPDQPGNRKQA